MSFEPQVINQLIKARRSTFPKQFDAGRKVDDAIVKQILENATWAPNHGNTEPWHFVVFTDQGLQKLAHFQSELYKELAGENFKEATYTGLQTNPLKASHVIAICMKRNEARRFPEMEEVAAVSCAVQNIYLSITAYGLGGYWTTGGVTYKPEAKAFFGLGDEDKLLGFFYIGHVAAPSPAGKRQPLEQKMTWVAD
jgi:nitroreductase